MNHIADSKTEYNLLLFLFPFQNVNMLTCFTKRHLPHRIWHLHISHSISCCCALASMLNFSLSSLSFMILFWFFLILSLYSLFLFFVCSFVLAYQSLNPCLIFSSFAGKILRILLEFFLPHSDLHIQHFVPENLPASRALLDQLKFSITSILQFSFACWSITFYEALKCFFPSA